jgi:RimJ/RimL family protein N-acetyltransferase
MSQTVEERYHLSSYHLTDVDEAFRHLSNPAVTKYLRTVPSPFTREDAVNYYYFLQQELKKNPQRAELNLTVRETATEKLVGGVRLEPDGEEWELGYWLGEEFWGQGIMTWACKEALRIAKREGIKKVYASPRQENDASRRVLEKNGFRHVRDEKQHYPVHDKMYDVWIFELDLANVDD